jgi:hypothetical protein
MTSFQSYILLAESTQFASLSATLFNYVDLRLLLHTETPDGSVIPVWEEVRPGNVAVMKDAMSACRASYDDVDVFYRRVPITAERSPDFSDFGELIAVMLGPNMAHTPIVVNDQLGRGRSTLTSVGVNWRKLFPHLYLRWDFIRPSLSCYSSGLQLPCSCHPALESESDIFRLRHMGRFPICNPPIFPFGDSHIQSSTVCAIMQRPFPALSLNISPDLLRVIRKGPAVKAAVDDAIDQCAEVLNLRDSIEEARIRAEQVTDEREKRSLAQRGLLHRSPQINIFLIVSKAFKICGDTSS